MQYYRCKCGNAQAWGSMPPERCSGCKKCKTTLSKHPDFHQSYDPETAHDFSYVEQVETDNGTQPLTRCKYCYRSKKEINK